MNDEATRAKVSATLRAIGHKPSIQGGNGRPMSIPQALLLERLGRAWVAEHVVPTKRKSPWPRCYKIDIAHPQKKIAIEVDGLSHCALKRKAQDQKKTDLLTGFGWRVLRFKNQEVVENIEGVLSTILECINCTPTSPTV